MSSVVGEPEWEWRWVIPGGREGKREGMEGRLPPLDWWSE